MRKLDPFGDIPGMSGKTVGDFWAWAYSDILSNRNRGVFAEFVVAAALGLLDAPRVEWDAVDLRYRGAGIEVKSSAYVQSWEQAKHSIISFDVAQKKGWDAEANTTLTEATRSAAIYVFCLYPEKDKSVANILGIPSWRFYVLPPSSVDAWLGNQKTVGLARLEKLCDAPIGYSELKERVDGLLDA